MKNLKYLVFTLAIVLFSCSGSEDTSSTTPTTVQATGAINWNAFTSANLNISSLVTFGGVAANAYTVKTIKGDKVNFTFNTGNKSSSKITRDIFLVYIDTTAGHGKMTEQDNQFFQNIRYIQDTRDQNNDFYSGFEILPGAPENYDLKFDMYCRIKENGVLLPDFYLIDPKITIRPSR